MSFNLSVKLWCFCVVKYVNPITKVCIIRASREEYQKVWSAITMVRSIGNCPVLFNLLDLSGKSNNSQMETLRACCNAYVYVCVSISISILRLAIVIDPFSCFSQYNFSADLNLQEKEIKKF